MSHFPGLYSLGGGDFGVASTHIIRRETSKYNYSPGLCSGVWTVVVYIRLWWSDIKKAREYFLGYHMDLWRWKESHFVVFFCVVFHHLVRWELRTETFWLMCGLLSSPFYPLVSHVKVRNMFPSSLLLLQHFFGQNHRNLMNRSWELKTIISSYSVGSKWFSDVIIRLRERKNHRKVWERTDIYRVWKSLNLDSSVKGHFFAFFRWFIQQKWIEWRVGILKRDLKSLRDGALWPRQVLLYFYLNSSETKHHKVL